MRFVSIISSIEERKKRFYPNKELAGVSVVQFSEIPGAPSARTSCSKESSRCNSV
jgi:hypothetical protein